VSKPLKRKKSKVSLLIEDDERKEDGVGSTCTNSGLKEGASKLMLPSAFPISVPTPQEDNFDIFESRAETFQLAQQQKKQQQQQREQAEMSSHSSLQFTASLRTEDSLTTDPGLPSEDDIEQMFDDSPPIFDNTAINDLSDGIAKGPLTLSDNLLLF
jgi:hypothetical protein